MLDRRVSRHSVSKTRVNAPMGGGPAMTFVGVAQVSVANEV